MKSNETTTTALLFLFVATLVVGTLVTVSIQRGDLSWQPSAAKEVEPRKPPAYANFGVHPSFTRPQPKLKTDKDDLVSEPTGPQFSLPPLSTLGLGLSFVGLVWLLVEAFSQGAAWGCAVLFGNLLGGVAFLFAYPGRAWRPLSVQCVGYASLWWASIRVL